MEFEALFAAAGALGAAALVAFKTTRDRIETLAQYGVQVVSTRARRFYVVAAGAVGAAVGAIAAAVVEAIK